MARIDIKGDIITNDDAWIYDWIGWDYVCPKAVRDAIDSAKPDETIDVYINSPGGFVSAGQEIYSMLRNDARTRIHIEGQACSAASIIAMAGHSDISPVGMLMIHNVQGAEQGDYRDMKKMSDVLKAFNSALAEAYEEKTGKTHEEILKAMDNETWLTANQCVELGFVDEISGSSGPTGMMINAVGGIRLTEEIRKKVLAEKAKKESEEAQKAELNELISDLDAFGI